MRFLAGGDTRSVRISGGGGVSGEKLFIDNFRVDEDDILVL